DVLAEHLRLGSSSVILSRTFHRPGEGQPFEEEVGKLRQAERELAARSPEQVQADSKRIAETIRRIAAGMGSRA
ncbi:MAG TPA: aldolase, partial [Ramlibacter sp.]|nr:aldolase [Ramlibacter sp.]